MFGGDVLAPAQQRLQRARQQPSESTAAFAQVRPACADALPMPCQQVGEQAEGFVELGFQLLAHQPRQHRRAATAGNRDLQRPAGDAGRHVEARGFGIVHGIRPDPARIGGVDHRVVGCGIVGGGNRQPGIVQPCRRELPGQVLDTSFLHPLRERWNQCWRTEHDHCAGLQQRLAFALGDGAAADHQHASATQVGEQRKQGWRRGRRCGAGGHGWHAMTLPVDPARSKMARAPVLMSSWHKQCLDRVAQVRYMYRLIRI